MSKIALKNQGHEVKPDLILSDSKTKFAGKIHSTTHKRVKSHQGKTSNNTTKQNPDNQNRNAENYLGGACVCVCVCSGALCDKKALRGRIKRTMALKFNNTQT